MSQVATIDLGNSNPHVGIFHDEKLSEVISLESFLNQKNIKSFKIGASIVGDKSQIAHVDYINCLDFRENQNFFDMPVQYEKTLGCDRLVQAYFAYSNSRQKQIVIDTGTFITVDFISSEGFLGGYILPGVLKTLDLYSQGAHLFRPKINQYDLIFPKSTESAMAQGAMGLYKSFLEKSIEKFGPEKIWLTGGQSHIIENILDESLSLKKDSHMIHHAIYQVLRKGEKL